MSYVPILFDVVDSFKTLLDFGNVFDKLFDIKLSFELFNFYYLI